MPAALFGTVIIADHAPLAATVAPVIGAAVSSVSPVGPDRVATVSGARNPVPLTVIWPPGDTAFDDTDIAVGTTVYVAVAVLNVSVTVTVYSPGSTVLGTVIVGAIVPKLVLVTAILPASVTPLLTVVVPETVTSTPLNFAVIVPPGTKPSPLRVMVAFVGPLVGVRVIAAVGRTVYVADAVFGVATESETVIVYVPAGADAGITM